MNTMNRRDGEGLIAPCRVQLLSLNQPCAAISGVRRAKRLQPAISFRLSPAIKHPSPICDRSDGHTSAWRACAGTVSGNSAAWQAPGAMSTARSVHAHEDPDSDSVTSRRGIRCANVCRQVPYTPMHRGACHTVMTSFVTLYLQLLLFYHYIPIGCCLTSTPHFCVLYKIAVFQIKKR